jgi:hypothetical protein
VLLFELIPAFVMVVVAVVGVLLYVANRRAADDSQDGAGHANPARPGAHSPPSAGESRPDRAGPHVHT